MEQTRLAIEQLLAQIAVEDDEMPLLSVLFERVEDELRLRHASLVYGPPGLAKIGWAGWRSLHTPPLETALDSAAAISSDFAYDGGGFLGGRVAPSRAESEDWLRTILEDGRSPTLGPLPEATAQLQPPATLLHVLPRLFTPVARLAVCAVRPLHGFFLPGEPKAELVVPSQWTVEQAVIHGASWGLLGFALPDGSDPSRKAAAPGLLVARLQRTAWFNDVRGTGDFTGYELHIGRDPAYVDLADLEVELREWVDGELAAARRVRLDEIDLSGMLKHDTLTMILPTLGRGAAHEASLHDRSGRLLDATERSHLIEAISVRMTIDAGSESLEEKMLIGRTVTPTLKERLERREENEQAYRDMLEAGTGARVIAHGDDARPLVREILEQVGTEILIMDRYFGGKTADWVVLSGLKQPVRVLVGPKGAAPPIPTSLVEVRRWTRSKPFNPPFHDRVYVWEGGGLSLGTSPSGLGTADTRLDRLNDVESAAWRGRFETYWNSGDFAAI